MGFAARHPRYTIALVVLLFVSFLVLMNSDSSSVSRPYPISFHEHGHGHGYPPPGYVEEQINRSEAYYQESLKERQKLITKWGPSPSEVEAFPSKGEFYTLWDFFTPAFQCPHRTQRIGTLGDGGKWVCGLERIEQKKDCVIYSVGINGESSFEASLLERASDCQVYGYDFSVKSFGPEIEDVPSLKRRAHFKPYALGGVDAHGPTDNPPFYTLATLMAQNNHTFIDILKIDIEGAEFDALEALIDAYPSASSSPGLSNKGTDGRSGGGLPFGQLQLEVHVRDMPWTYFPRFLLWWEKLEKAGLRPFWTEPNLVYVNIVRGVRPDLAEYSFINIRGTHELVSDRYMPY